MNSLQALSNEPQDKPLLGYATSCMQLWGMQPS